MGCFASFILAAKEKYAAGDGAADLGTQDCAITLKIWKKGEAFDAELMKLQAA